jgi:hypothetical protein
MAALVADASPATTVAHWTASEFTACFGLGDQPIPRSSSKSECKGKKVYFSSPTFTKFRFSSLNSKTGQITSLNFSNRAFYLPGAVSKAVLLQ